MRHLSNIYWHFTGSPTDLDWHSITSPKQISKRPKSNKNAFEILLKIIKSKKLIASATEELFKGIETDKFCCVTDIPLQNLLTHTKTYGKVAIGFSSNRIHTSHFNPVLYLPKNKLPSQQANPTTNISLNFPAILELELLFLNSGFEKLPNDSWKIPAIVDPVIPDKSLLPKYFINHIKITEFSDKIGESFYQEQEWRKKGDFYFEYNDIEAIIIPKEYLAKIYKFFTSENLTIPILTWDIIKKSP